MKFEIGKEYVGDNAGRIRVIAAGVEAMREACAQCVEDVEGDAGPMTVATRIRALVILE